jgi:hypothetical protein
MWNGCVDHDPSGQILSAWIAKEELRALCATAARGGHPGEIRDRLHTFYLWCANAQIPELTTLAETIETWWPAIEVFLTTGLTNARTEGTNRLIKQVKRAACGFRNRENTGAAYGCTAPGEPADCQRGNRRRPPKIEEPVRARSVQLIRGRGVRRWSTASWWRRTRISMSFVMSDRVCSTIQPRTLENIK